MLRLQIIGAESTHFDIFDIMCAREYKSACTYPEMCIVLWSLLPSGVPVCNPIIDAFSLLCFR